ncbi:MAG: Cna B-type domain-containing protein, partial [Eubacteriales bacterium]|nr:Cna B-type domain-containing protein [Eubacteriales bacterium]
MDAGSYTWGAGGGVLIVDGSTFNFSGGSISRNIAGELGGAVSVGDQHWSDGKPVLNMTGGVMEGNIVGATGGAIFVQVGRSGYGTPRANIYAGQLIDNKALGTGISNNAFGGGAIYVNGIGSAFSGEWNKGEALINHAIITGNEAVYGGGGYAGCPVSETEIYLTNGVALYGNKSGSGADEIFLLSSDFLGTHSGQAKYRISDSMLGGRPYNWKYPNGELLPHNKLSGVLPSNSALSLRTDEVADAEAKALAKVNISGNYSVTRGGGIGSNGIVFMGEYDTIEIKVEKKWDDMGAESKRPKSISFDILRQIKGSSEEPVVVGYELVKPDEEGNWALTVTNLPKLSPSGEHYEYTIKERSLTWYEAEVSGDQDTGLILTNKPIKAIEIPVVKRWVETPGESPIHPSEIYVFLLADGIRTGHFLELSEGNQWRGVFKNLPEKKAGKLINYTIGEVSVDGYSSSIT